jgi:S-formylglutathione hydrolase FrmB
MRRIAKLPAILFLLCLGPAAQGASLKGSLTDNQLIKSEVLDYSLQYRVYGPPEPEDSPDATLPVLYVTDGQWYIEHGGLPKILDDLIAAGHIRAGPRGFRRQPRSAQSQRQPTQARVFL